MTKIQGSHILITGGSGFIGHNLAARFVQDGALVRVLSRNPHTARLQPGVEIAAWDARTPAGWGHLIEDTDIVVNLAGENLGSFPWSDDRVRRIRSSRVEAGQALVAAIHSAAHRPQMLLQASGIGYYGIDLEREMTESSPPGQDVLAQICVAWEASTQPVEELGVRRVVTRTALVLDSQEGVLPRMALPFKLFIGGPLGNGNQWVPWIHRMDEVGAMAALIANYTAQGSFNLVAPGIVRNTQFGRALARVLHRPYWLPAPGFFLRWVLGRMSILVLDGQKAIPQRLNQFGYAFHFPEIQTALADVYML
ncbi:MAG: TIGR01777 family oxidoreductase [Anaerolineaceae bacterium]|nr:TIGR01777 family oxidoreductase [Anaerolineaceae bacterium]